MVNGFTKVTISPLQKRFQLTSRDMGLVASTYDITSIMAVIPLTYLCAKGNKKGAVNFEIMRCAAAHFFVSPFKIFVFYLLKFDLAAP